MPAQVKPYVLVTFGYVLFGVLWILISDRALALMIRDIEALNYLQTLKGWAYVTLSGLLVFGLSRAAYRLQEAKEQEKQAVFRKTIEGANHILLNYLNQMQLVIMEAEGCPEFDREVIVLSEQLAREATAEVAKLQKLEAVSEEVIDQTLYEEQRTPPAT